MLKFDAGKSAREIFHLPFWIDFWSGLGVWGLAEFKLRLQADFNKLSSHTPCTPGRGAADQKSIQNQCKIDAGKRHAKSMENDAKAAPNLIDATNQLRL